MKKIFHKILTNTALCFAVGGCLISCLSTPWQQEEPLTPPKNRDKNAWLSFSHDGRYLGIEKMHPSFYVTDADDAASLVSYGFAADVDEKKHIYTFKYNLCDGNTPIGLLSIPMKEIREGGRLTGVSMLEPTLTLNRKYENLRVSYFAFEPAIYKSGAYWGDIDVCLKILPTEENAGTIKHSFGFIYEKGKDGEVMMRTSADNVPFDVPENAMGTKKSIFSRDLSLQFLHFEK